MLAPVYSWLVWLLTLLKFILGYYGEYLLFLSVFFLFLFWGVKEPFPFFFVHTLNILTVDNIPPNVRTQKNVDGKPVLCQMSYMDIRVIGMPLFIMK